MTSEIRFLSQSLVLHANNDYESRFEHRYGVLKPLAGVFDKLSLPESRGVRAVMMGSSDKRYLVQDAMAPNFHYCWFKGLCWALTTLIVVSALAMLLFSIGAGRRLLRQ